MAQADAERVRNEINSNLRFRLELVAAVSRTLRDFDIDIADEAVSTLTIADATEMKDTGPEPSIDP